MVKLCNTISANIMDVNLPAFEQGLQASHFSALGLSYFSVIAINDSP